MQAALTQFADPEWRPVGRARLAEATVRALRAAEPGSDLQLAWARVLGTTARSPEQVGLVRGLLDGSAEVPGLAVDTDLRWHLLQRLVTLGEEGDEAIAAELERDPTSAGERQAATARALRPTAEAKAEAWRLAVEDESLPNAVHSAVVAGFASAEQLELLEPWVDPYFEAVGRVWETRTAEFAQSVAVGLYPGLLVSPTTVERTDAYLASGDVPPALRRLLLEGRDGVARALRARARDAAAAR